MAKTTLLVRSVSFGRGVSGGAHLKMQKIVTIERGRLDPNRAYGVIVAQSPSLTLVHQLDDFQFNGYFVVRTKDITSCETSRGNDYSRRIMRREWLWEAVQPRVKKLSVTGWPELIGDIVGKVVILEDEVGDEFYIGPILEAQNKRVLIHNFDCCGRFMEVENVPYGRITSMTFGDLREEPLTVTGVVSPESWRVLSEPAENAVRRATAWAQ